MYSMLDIDILVIIFWFSFNAMYLSENSNNLSGTKKMFSLSACFPTLSENEKIFSWYDKRFSHYE